jgi:preprotein translocase subunit SecE
MKVIGKIKHVVQDLHWPSVKEIISDTLLTVCATTVLALAVSGWTHVIEYVVDLVVSLF